MLCTTARRRLLSPSAGALGLCLVALTLSACPSPRNGRRVRARGGSDDGGDYATPLHRDYKKLVGELVDWGDMYCRHPLGWRGPCDQYEVLFPRRTEARLLVKTDKAVTLQKLPGWKLVKRSKDGRTHRFEGRFSRKKRVRIKLFNRQRERRPVYYMVKIWPKPRYMDGPRRNKPTPELWKRLKRRAMKKRLRRAFYRGPYLFIRERRRQFPGHQMWKKHRTERGRLDRFEALDVKVEPGFCYGVTMQLTPGSRFSTLAMRDLAVEGVKNPEYYRSSLLGRGRCGSRQTRVWTSDIYLHTLRNTPLRNKLGFGRYVMTVYRRPEKWQGRLDGAGFKRELTRYTRGYQRRGVVAKGMLGKLGTLKVKLAGGQCHRLVMTLNQDARFSETVLRRGQVRTDIRLKWEDISAGPGLRGRGLIMDVGCIPKNTVGRLMVRPYAERSKLGWGAFQLHRYSRPMRGKEIRCGRCQKIYADCEEAGGARCSRRRHRCRQNAKLRRGDCK